MLDVDEAHRQQNEVGLDVEGTARNLLRPGSAAVERRFPLDLHQLGLANVTVQAGKTPRGQRPIPFAALFVRARAAQDVRPVGPVRIARLCPLLGLGQDLDLAHRLGAEAVGGPDAVRAGVAAADHEHGLVLRRDDLARVDLARDEAVRRHEEVHRKVDSIQLPPGRRQVARLTGSECEQDGVELLAQRGDRKIVAHRHAGSELDAFGC